jgi:hypothetical protein
MEILASENPKKILFDRLAVAIPAKIPPRYLPAITVHLKNGQQYCFNVTVRM